MDFAVLLAFALTVFLLLIGVEIIAVIGMGTILFTVLTGQFNLQKMALTAFDSLNNFPLIAMPLFILTGDLISQSGISQKIAQLGKAIAGHFSGGLAMTAIVASGIFAAISGSNSATTAAMGRIMVPDMKQDGYSPEMAGATVAAGGVVGIIIPPSIVFVIYGVTAGVSVGDLFLGGIFPGLIFLFMLCLAANIISKRMKLGSVSVFSFKNLLEGIWAARLALIAIFIILGGIYGGVFTPSEAGAIAALYCFLAGILITKQIKIKEIPQVMERSSLINGMIGPIIAIAIVFSQIIGYLRIPQEMAGFLFSITQNEILLMLIIMAIILIAGAVLEATPNVILLTPILGPMALSLGYEPIHFGVIMVSGLAIGFITPPVGLNLYVASSITNIPFTRIASSALPYFLSLLIGWILITFFPIFTNLLINL